MARFDKPDSRRGGGTGRDASIAVLIAANLVPLAGVLVWGWSVFNVVVLYWLENVIVGAINILKMLTCAPDPGQVDLGKKVKQRVAARTGEVSAEEAKKLRKFEEMIDTHEGKLGLLNHATKLFLIPFFAIHYGFFCFVHGCFVFLLLGDREGLEEVLDGGSGPGGFLELLGEAVAVGGIWAALALALSHFFPLPAITCGRASSAGPRFRC